MEFMTTYSTIETTRRSTVATVGVKKRLCILAKTFGIALCTAMESNGASSRQNRGLGRGRRGGEHHQQQQVIEDVRQRRVAKDRGSEDREHVVGVVRITETDAMSSDTRKGLGGENDERVNAEQHEGRVDARLARNGFGVSRLLIQVRVRCPSPSR